MNIKNLEHLKKAVKYRGFPEELNAVLEKHITEGAPEFELKCRTKRGEDEIAFRLHFSKHKLYDFYYFNKFEATLLEKGQNEARVHTFYPDQNITALEAYNLLKYGEKTAVNKNIFDKEGKTYNAWITLDLTGEKDQHGNYPVQKYHENYYASRPFKLATAINDLAVPIKEWDQPEKLDIIFDKLRKGTPAEVSLKGNEAKGYLMVNAREGRIQLYDSSLQLIEGKDRKAAQRKEQDDASLKNNPSVPKEGEVKKKPWQNQRIRRKPKGPSI